MKKILLLGGSAQQLVAIKTAKSLGYYTVLCDFLTDNPGQHIADKSYYTSTIDKDAVLKIAQEEKIDGVLAFASDPAAPTAAYVAEKMKLPGNPYQSVEILCNKDKFRAFLRENGFNAPQCGGYSSVKEALADIERYAFPIIVKPVDSSGSKGATVLHSQDKLAEAVAFALSFSRNGRIIIEEFIEKKHPYLIGGDIFIENGKIVLWGLMNCHRDNCVNPLVPVGKSYPLQLNEDDVVRVKKVLTDMVSKLGIKNGGMNVELIVDKRDRVFPIDIGPRCGGNMIPDFLGDIFGVDVIKMSVCVAMGESLTVEAKKPTECFATLNLHASKNGIYKGIVYAPEIEPYIYRKALYKKAGDFVQYFDNASKCLGIVFLKFPSVDVQKTYMDSINEWINVMVE